MNEGFTAEQKEFEIRDNLNNKFRIIFVDKSIKSIKKVLNNGNLVDPTREELIYIMKELQKMLETLKTENITQDYDSLLISIKNLIDNGTLNSLDEIRNYINGLDLSQDDKEKLIQESYKYLESKSVEKTPIILFKDKIIEQKIIDIKRRGKWLMFELNDYYLLSHLRMEGKYNIKNKGEEIDKHEHVSFVLDDNTELRYRDTRKFGRMHLISKDEVYSVRPLNELGLEPWDKNLTASYLKEKYKNIKLPIKTVTQNHNS